MLDEGEFDLVVKAQRPGVPSEERFAPFLAEYERITGYHATNFNAVWHHRLSLLGDPCVNCGKPLRSPRARFCAACGHRVGTAGLGTADDVRNGAARAGKAGDEDRVDLMRSRTAEQEVLDALDE